MNDARRRRLALQKRIKEQQKLRESEDFLEEGSCIHDVSFEKTCSECEAVLEEGFQKVMRDPEVMAWRLKNQLGLNDTLPAIAFIRPHMILAPVFPVRINLSARNPTEQIMAMRKNGFWAVDHGYLTWFGPELITEVSFLNGE
jgi:hypothetical protein